MRRRTDTWSQPFVVPRRSRPPGRNLDLTACDDAANLKRLFGVGAISLPAEESAHAVARVTVRDRFDRSLAAALASSRQACESVVDLVHDLRTPVHAAPAIKVQPVPVKVQRV